MQPATEAFQDLSILLDWDENDDSDALLLDYENEQSPIFPLQQQQQHPEQEQIQQSQRIRHAPFSMNSPATTHFSQELEDGRRRRRHHHKDSKPPPALNLKENIRTTSTSTATASSSIQTASEGARYPLQGNRHDDGNDHSRRDAWNERVDKLLHFVENYEFSKTPAKTAPTTKQKLAATTDGSTTTTAMRHNTSSHASCSSRVNKKGNSDEQQNPVHHHDFIVNNGQGEADDNVLVATTTTAEDLWQEAQREREAARTWANQVRAAASKWIREQEELQKMLQLQLEQQQHECAEQMRKQQQAAAEASSSPTMTSGGNNVHQQQPATTAVTLELHRKVHELKEELEQSRARHLAIQEQLHCIIDDQQDRILYLEQQIQAQGTANTNAASLVEQPGSSRDLANRMESSTTTLSLRGPPQHQQHGLRVDEGKQPQDLMTMDDSSPRSVLLASTPFHEQQHSSMTDDESPRSYDNGSNVHNHSILISPESVKVPPVASAAFVRDALESSLTENSNHQKNEPGHGCDNPKSGQYHLSSHPPTPLQFSKGHVTGPQIAQQPSRRRRRLKTPEGHDVIQYANGTLKEIHADGTTILRFANGDIQTNSGEGDNTSTAYYFCATNVLRLDQADKGFSLWEFPNGQIEQHFHNGRKVVHLPDGTRYEVPAESSSSSNQQQQQQPDDGD